MTGRMNWRKAHLHGRTTLDYRREFEFEDAAAKWLRRFENNPEQRRARTQAISKQLTPYSSEGPPW
jgi:hypothetical protein